MAFDYDAFVTAVETTLRADGSLENVHVSQEGDEPTATQAQTGAIQLELVSFERTPRRLVGVPANHPYDETIEVSLRLWVFSAAGVADARKRRNQLITTVLTVCAAQHTWGGTVTTSDVLRGRAETGVGVDRTPFARADLQLVASLQLT